MNNQEVFFRIHEKTRLDHPDDSKLGIMKLEGIYVDENGLPLELNSQYKLHEKVNSV